MGYTIFRVQKLKPGHKGQNTIGQTLRHLNKHKETAEISKPQNTENNALVGNCNYNEVKELIEKAKAIHKQNNKRAVRNDAAVGIEVVLSYTPTATNQNLQFAKQFEKVIEDFIKNEFPDICKIAFARHCDENSFHWHLVLMPYNKRTKRFSANDYLKDSKYLSQLQTKFAEYCKHLGLQRGISKSITKSNHQTKEEHNRQILTQQHKQKQKTIQEAHKALDEVFR